MLQCSVIAGVLRRLRPRPNSVRYTGEPGEVRFNVLPNT